jgi:integrase
MKLGPQYARSLDLVFPNEIGMPMDLRNLSGRAFKPLVKAIGVPEATVHWLRHTVATQLLAAGESPKVIAERLGHTSTQQVLDTYGHVLEGMQQGATDKLEQLLYGNS